jgi:hypothetical protein
MTFTTTEIDPPETTYDELIDYFKSCTRDWYQERNIYCERHHIVPRCEGGSSSKENTVYLPVKHHFLAHVLRAREATDPFFKNRNYLSANLILGRKNCAQEVNFSEVTHWEAVYEMKAALRENFLRIKRPIEEYYRKVVCLETGEVFESLKEASQAEGVSRSHFCSLLKGLKIWDRPRHFAYYSENVDLEAELDKIKKREDLIRETRGSKYREEHPNLFRKILCVNTGEVFNSISDIEHQGHIIECCLGKRKTAHGMKWRFYDD